MRTPDRRIVRAVRRWYREKGRTLPWRGERDPYRILLSEIMLQQTQVSRVLEKYPQFLRRFPTLSSLSRARRRDVVTAWRGMGYNNRAVRLHALAAVLVERGMRLPREASALEALPGIGPYTAHALLSSVHGFPVPVVDVNVRRLLSRFCWRMDSTARMRSEREIWDLASRILPRRSVYDWNQALMDLGATVCTSRSPRCGICPLGARCASRGTMTPAPAGRRNPGTRMPPDRIYRGRLVEALRNEQRGMSARRLARTVRPSFSSRDVRWLRNILRGLERDGLIRIGGGSDLLRARVALA